jgi:hypothetical protein
MNIYEDHVNGDVQLHIRVHVHVHAHVHVNVFFLTTCISPTKIHHPLSLR